jgi:hypothetical protein
MKSHVHVGLQQDIEYIRNKELSPLVMDYCIPGM